MRPDGSCLVAETCSCLLWLLQYCKLGCWRVIFLAFLYYLEAHNEYQNRNICFLSSHNITLYYSVHVTGRVSVAVCHELILTFLVGRHEEKSVGTIFLGNFLPWGFLMWIQFLFVTAVPKYLNWHVFRCARKLRKATISFVMSVRLFGRPSAWNNSALTGRI